MDYALVHVAGELGERVPFDHYHESTWQRVMRINFESTVSLTRALCRYLARTSRPFDLHEFERRGTSARLLGRLRRIEVCA